LQIQATNSSNQVVNGTVSVSDKRKVAVRGTEGPSKLIRLLAHPTELTLTPSTSASSASGEGEGASAIDAAMAQVSSQLRRVSSAGDELAASVGSNNTQSYESVYAQDIEELMNANRG
jgi:hypothetical protein